MTTMLVENSMGTEEEAVFIYEYVQRVNAGNDIPVPEGWAFLGSGGSRKAYLAPSGIVYKISYSYNPEPNRDFNEVEHANFRRIEAENKLPEGWKVPKSYLHVFKRNVEQWSHRLAEGKTSEEIRVAVLACEYVKGRGVGWGAPHEDQAEQRKAFSAAGLYDCGGMNAIFKDDGTKYIVDAGETDSY